MNTYHLELLFMTVIKYFCKVSWHFMVQVMTKTDKAIATDKESVDHVTSGSVFNNHS